MLKQNSQMTMDSYSDYEGLYDILIEKDNFWRQMKDMVDFSFVYDLLKDSYSSTMGRKAEDVERMFKFLLLKQYYQLSDAGLIERTRTDMCFKYFLGYRPEDTSLIDPSLLTVFRRERIARYETDENGKRVKIKDSSEELMDQLVSKTVEMAIENGVMEKKKIRMIVDSTHSDALYGHVSPKEKLIDESRKLRRMVYEVDEGMKEKMPKKKERNLEEEIEYVNELLKVLKDDGRFESMPNTKEKMDYLEEIIDDTENELEYSKEQDAKIGHKSSDSSFFGYKTHTAVDADTGIVVAATVTSGEKHDGKSMQKLVEKTESEGLEVEAVIGDKAYSEKENLEYCEKKGIKNASKLSNCVLYGSRSKEDDFEFNKDAQMFVCKAGQMAIRKTHQKGSKSNNYTETETYFFDVEECRHCPFREGCYKEGAKSKSYSVTLKKETHIRQMEYMETDEFRELNSERYKIEQKNAEMKNVYGYGKANACGISGMTIQGATTLFLTNMKRIIKLKNEKSGEQSDEKRN